MASFLPTFPNPIKVVQNVLYGFLEIIGPGQVLVFPKENDGYAGTEYKYWRFVLRPDLYRYELYAVAFVLLYLVWWRVGRAQNRAKAKEWLEAALPVLNDNFTTISPDPKGNEYPFVADGADAYLTYATGRRGTIGMHTTLSLLPRHDPISLVRSLFISPILDLTAEPAADVVTITVSLRPEGTRSIGSKAWGVILEGDSVADGAGLRTGTWAVLKKQGMNERRKGRWDLSFPTIQSDASVGEEVSRIFAVMAEAPEVTTALLAPTSSGGTGLKEILEDPETSASLKSLIISDLPSYRPFSVLPHPAPLTITLTAALSTDRALIRTYLQLLFNLTDLLTPTKAAFPLTGIKMTTASKLRRTRVEAWQEIKTSSTAPEDAQSTSAAKTVEAVKGGAKKLVEEVKKDDLEEERRAGPGFTEEELAAMSAKSDKVKKEADKKAAEEKKRREKERKEKLKQQQQQNRK